jgi:hypothetical protein
MTVSAYPTTLSNYGRATGMDLPAAGFATVGSRSLIMAGSALASTVSL